MLINNNRTGARAQNHLKQRLVSPRVPIAATTRAQMVELLDQTLALTIDLKALLREAPWENKGMNFEALVTELEAYVDLFTSWISALDEAAKAGATVKPVAEEPDLSSIKDQVTALADHLVPYAKSLRGRSDHPESSHAEQRLPLQEGLPVSVVPSGDGTVATGKVTYQHRSQFRRAISKGLIRRQNTQGASGPVYYLPTSESRQPPACT